MGKAYHSIGGRNLKAKKINAILCDFLKEELISGKKILDIGCGTGEIALFFQNKNKVVCADMENYLDAAVLLRGGQFIKVNDEFLPFKDGEFDIVISNHVIEHVKDQKRHLSEIYRVLSPRGICYIATPNRFFPKETHTKTWLLHFFPNKIFFGLLKILKKYEEDIYLLTYFQLKKLFRLQNFRYKEYTAIVVQQREKFYLDLRFRIFMPNLFQCISPTTLFVLKKKRSSCKKKERIDI